MRTLETKEKAKEGWFCFSLDWLCFFGMESNKQPRQDLLAPWIPNPKKITHVMPQDASQPSHPGNQKVGIPRGLLTLGWCRFRGIGGIYTPWGWRACGQISGKCIHLTPWPSYWFLTQGVSLKKPPRNIHVTYTQWCDDVPRSVRLSAAPRSWWQWGKRAPSIFWLTCWRLCLKLKARRQVPGWFLTAGVTAHVWESFPLPFWIK